MSVRRRRAVDTARLEADEFAELERVYAREQRSVLAFDRSRLIARLERLSGVAKNHRCLFCPAVKGFGHAAYWQLAKEFVAGFDVSNMNEYRVLGPDLSGRTVWMSNPALHEIDAVPLSAHGNDLIFIVETREQFDRLRDTAAPAQYALRLDSHRLLGSGGRSRFGLDPTDLASLRAMTRADGHTFKGFHVHHPTEQNGKGEYLGLARRVLDICEGLGVAPEFLNLGGGIHHMTHSALDTLAGDLRKLAPSGPTFCFEPGRFLTEWCGYAIGQVKVRQTYHDHVQHVLDLSSTLHLRWSARQLLVAAPGGGWVSVAPVGEGESCGPDSYLATFYGPTCYEGDLVGRFPVPRDATWETGSLVCFARVSGYAVSLNSGFNGIGCAAVAIY